jgi:hypothetical protein
MRKVFVVLVLAFVFFMCDNDDMNKETNPYPDGVYPFEVTGVGHAQENYNNFTVTWTNPTDKGFSHAVIELYGELEWGGRLYYSSVTGKAENLPPSYGDNFVVGKNTLSYFDTHLDDKRVIIKCVDKFGNISGGVGYEYSFVF